MAPADRNEADGPEPCDLLIQNAYAITMDGGRSVHQPGAVAGAVIVAVGPQSDVEAAYRGRRCIDADGAPVHPGFIDLHVHCSVHLTSKLVDGRVVRRGGRLTTMDEGVIYAMAETSARRLIEAADAA